MKNRIKIFHKKSIVKAFLALFVAIFFPMVAFAQVSFTEIMYDLDGADSGREWIEICNNGASIEDLSLWKLYENKTNHTLTLIQGSGELSSGGVAVIASDDVKFLRDNPSFSGTLFDSSFSLSNTGETLEIRDPELVAIDSVSYISDWGGNGDGNSLTKSGESFSGVTPSPGSADCVVDNSNTGDTNTEDTTGNTDTDTTANNTTNVSTGTGSSGDLPTFKVFIKTDKKVIVGADTEFGSYVEGLGGKGIEADTYRWTFGDGSSKVGSQVLHHYSYPGEYVVFLDVSSGKISSSGKILVTASEARINISGIKDGRDGFIEITNNSLDDLDLSNWYLSSQNKTFMLPKHTIILKKNSVRFPSSVTSLVAYKGVEVSMLYPNGVVATTYSISDAIKPTVQSNPSVYENPNKPKQIISPSTAINKPNANDLHLVSDNNGDGDRGDNNDRGEISTTTLQQVSVAVASIEGDNIKKILSSGVDGGGSGNGAKGLLRWIIFLILIIMSASLGVIIVRKDDVKKDTSNKDFKKIAESIEIIED